MARHGPTRPVDTLCEHGAMRKQGVSVRRRRLLLASGAIGVLVLMASSGCAVRQLRESAALAREAEPFARELPQPQARLLVVGDSTATGTGASGPEASVPGLLAAADGGLAVRNMARSGARFRDLPAQLVATDAAAQRFDAVLILCGGNDVLRFTSRRHLEQDIARVAELAAQRAAVVVFVPPGNVGNAPAISVPWTWVMRERSQTLHALVRAAAARHGAAYVNLYRERDEDPFVTHAERLNASDGFHPSDAGYALWRDAIERQSQLGARLAR